LRSLFLRFFGTLAATVLAIWIAVLAYEAVVIQGKFEHVRRVETRAWARQILASLRRNAGDPEGMRATVDEIVRVRDAMYRESGYRKPSWRLQVWQRGTELYATDESSRSGRAPPPGWNEARVADPATGLEVRLAEELVVAWDFGLAGLKVQLTPLLYSIPFLLVPAWFSIRRGLRPVRDVVAAIESRSATDLAPLALSPYRELAPLIDSVNRLMARLSERLARERDFLSNAAHQLKTPLAVIQANAEMLAGAPALAQTVQGVDAAPDQAAASAAYAGLAEGVQDAAHVTHQLLALARSDRDVGSQAVAPCDLADLLRSRLALAAMPALRREIELVLHAPDSCILPLHRESVAALIDNLVDNAIKYSPDGASVEVILEHAEAQEASAPGCVRLSVRDHGPGIPAALRARVFERFFRVPGQDKPGSGLGLAIVDQVARTHGAHLRLADNPDGSGAAPGLNAVVEWPLPAADGA
jgi:two-component system sensor histidine kinase QseC